MTYTVQKNIPVPIKKRAPAKRKYPLDTMKVGEMFFVPNLTKNTLIAYISRAGRELNKQFATRLVWMVRKRGMWEPATASTPRAVQGVGVWRRR